jgi:hypothetical protein
MLCLSGLTRETMAAVQSEPLLLTARLSRASDPLQRIRVALTEREAAYAVDDEWRSRAHGGRMGRAGQFGGTRTFLEDRSETQKRGQRIGCHRPEPPGGARRRARTTADTLFCP